MDKRNWKIIYSSYSGLEKKAIELVSREMGTFILRDTGRYTYHVLACEKAEAAALDKNAVVIGTYDENKIIKNYIKRDEIPENGYVVKVMDNPENTGLKIVLITALHPTEVFYGATDFVDDYFVFAAPKFNALRISSYLFEHKLPDYYNASAPQTKRRAAWTWAHPINNYREYIENMARLRLNTLVLWNDYAPLNAKDVVSYAHEYGIKVIWGYAWGWDVDCNAINLDTLDKLSDSILEKYEKEYADTGADGIYFQSFTEVHNERIGGKLIADAVVDFVNKTSAKFYAKYPDLLIQFGLHAWPVENHLDFIEKVDSRLEIVWEDCGAFPFNYEPKQLDNEKTLEETMDFADRIINLRNKGKVGLLYKGCLVMDWTAFVHQSGPYILGSSSAEQAEHDRRVVTPIWRYFQSEWFRNGKDAYDMTRHILKSCSENTLFGVVGNFAGGLWFPEALCAQILWECDKPYDDILYKVSKRRSLSRI